MQELLRKGYIGNPAQLVTLRRVTVSEGRAKGTSILEVRTAGGLELGIRMTISWSGDTLPILSQWRSMASGDYVLGLEPTNCYTAGRHDERRNGTLPVLKAFESVNHTVCIEFSEK